MKLLKMDFLKVKCRVNFKGKTQLEFNRIGGPTLEWPTITIIDQLIKIVGALLMWEPFYVFMKI